MTTITAAECHDLVRGPSVTSMDQVDGLIKAATEEKDLRIAELEAQNRRLAEANINQVGTITSLRSELEMRKAQHHADINIIGEALIEEAESRDWCEEYDSVIDGLNSRLTMALPIRDVDKDYTHTFSVDVSAYHKEDDTDDVIGIIEQAIADGIRRAGYVSNVGHEGSEED